ncbi:MAG TPA: undecaprenyldiphospho-muramoylpentapeptide beta-N-acetylglucosaminyltransferase [Burkholderiales bacterium]|jgi:UDP-N-acetylglucosamine--N-acetylmuramyl-(pentapeptide) pyrophosphoryl-undecaprenol N-acetylglucosamine transferase
MARTIMIMAGGTGGHVFPGLAVADFLRDAGWRVVWLGSKSGMEGTLVPERGYDMASVNFSGLRGKGLVAALLLPLKLLLAFWQSAGAIFAQRPDVVLGMGGYMSFPGGMMAALLGRPLVIHEQNSIPGLANRVLAGVADRVLCAFPGALKHAVPTGNPVRPEIAKVAAPEERYAGRSGPLRVLVIGGSLGAKALNDTVPLALALLPAARRPQVTHQSGPRDLQPLQEAYAAAGVQARTLAFIENMAAVYSDADLVVCRAGASTLAEIAVVGVASILVPYPHAVDDHQTTNARFLADAGAAVLLPQKELNPKGLAELLGRLDRQRLCDMARRARSLGRPEATEAVAMICAGLVR